ncbi:hypothetical protein UlMin_008494 [Ulmus minor]
MAIKNKMRIHGDKTEDMTIVEKILRSMTPTFNFLICSIEESLYVDELSIEKLQSSLGRGRGRGRGNNDHGNQQQHQHQHQDNQFQGRVRGGNHSTTYKSRSVDKSNVECYRCHRYGHYKSEC